MADKSIDQLNEAEKIYATDLFVLQQSGSAKKLTGQVLLNWLTAAADGHGGISGLDKVGTSGLVDTYRITLADKTTYDFAVTNGRGIKRWSKTGTSGLVDTYTMTLDDGTALTYTVKNGEKGEKGDNAYTWVKYASQEPTEESHSIGDIPDDWRGEYNGPLAEAPTDWKQYKWFKHKGEKGDTGKAATLVTKSVTYQVSDSGTIIPSGSWGSSIPVVSQGKYLWTKTEVRFNTGDPIVSYSVARMGIDGSGAVSSVAGVSPDATGNVTLTAADVGALAVSGGDMTGEIRMNGQPISGLNDPTEDTQAARKGYVDAAKTAANAYTDTSVRKAAPRNLLDNSDFRNPVNQRGQTNYSLSAWGGYCIDRWAAYSSSANVTIGSGGLILSGCIHQPISSDVVSMYNGKVLTLAVKIAGTVYCCSGEVNQIGAWHPSARFDTPYGYINFETENNNYMYVIIDNSTTPSVVEWAAIYEGEYTAETMPEYQPKGYGAELLECQRYFYRRNFLCVLHPANKSNLSEYRGEIMFPVEMRTNPQCAFEQNEGNISIGPTNNQYCLLVGTPNESGWCTTKSRLDFIADL